MNIKQKLLLSTISLSLLAPVSADEINNIVRNNGLVLTKTKTTRTTNNQQPDQIQKLISSIPEHPNNTNPNLSKEEIAYYENLDKLVSQFVITKRQPDLIARESGFIRPVSYSINSSYGMRKHPILGDMRMHTGVDFAAPEGTPIKAVKSGYVVFSNTKGGYGKTVILQHDEKYSSLYGHASKLLVREGQFVKQGQTIALVGSTGRSTGPHLHFEIFEYGKRINPTSKL